MSSRPPKGRPPGRTPTPEEGMAIILAGAPPNKKREFARDLVSERKKVPPNLPDVAKRRRIESEIRRKSGRSQIQLNTELVLMYDELSDQGMLRRRNAR